jgi:two-component system NtrC family sensor kinase
MDPERKTTPRHTDVPITERKVAVRLPPECLDRLLVAVCEIEAGQDPEDTLDAILGAASAILPALSFGVRVPDTRPGASAPMLVVRRTLALVAAEAPQEGPLFPELGHESQFPIDFEPDGVLSIAAGDASALPEAGALSALASRLALAIGAAMRTSRQLAPVSTRTPGAGHLRRAADHDKLAGLGKIVAGVVHELNNPVTSILAYAEYLRRKAERGALESADVDRIARIEEAAERIHAFSRDLIAYARPSTEVPVPLVIHDVIERALLFCEHVLDRARVAVDRSFGEVKPIHGTSGQLAQVFVNLFTNAANAMSGPGGTLRIETSLEDGGRSVHVAVIDSGSGIAEHALPRLFEPFFTTNADGQGTGLGLSIVRDIVEAHRGRVWAERREGSGAAFHVVLPAQSD